jgi:hypothetical protein
VRSNALILKHFCRLNSLNSFDQVFCLAVPKKGKLFPQIIKTNLFAKCSQDHKQINWFITEEFIRVNWFITEEFIRVNWYITEEFIRVNWYITE